MKRIKAITLFALLFISILISVYYFSLENESYVVNGVIDIKEYLPEEKVIGLDGEWEFYWGELLEPSEFQKGPNKAASMRYVPDGWNQSTTASEKGCATYRVILENLNPDREYGIVKKNIRIASKVYVDGKLLSEDGVPSCEEATEVMGNTAKVLHFFPVDHTTQIIIQVSNYKYYSGGIVESIEFGTVEAVEREQQQQLIFESILFAYLMVICITLAILVIRFPEFRDEKVGSYYMPFTVLAFTIINGSLGERLLKLIFTGISTELLIRIEYIAVGVLLMSLTISIHLMDQKLVSRKLTGLVTGFYFLITPVVIFTEMNAHFIWTLISVVTIVALPVEFLIVLYRYIWSEGIQISVEEHTLILVILYLVNLYSLDVVIFTFGPKNDLELAFVVAAMFGFAWFLLIIYRYSLTIKKNNEMSIKLMESYYNIEENASSARRNEMAFLQAQIKPHFLFNSLSSIIGLITQDPKRAQTILRNLTTYLKNLFLIDRDSEYIYLESELNLIEIYVSIEQERFGERLTFMQELDQDLTTVKIIPLLIQPLVENAIHHGALKRESGGWVKLTIKKMENTLLVLVEDNGPDISEKKLEQMKQSDWPDAKQETGIGVQNIRERLAYYYQESLHYEKSKNGGIKVWYQVPIKKEEIPYAEGSNR